MSLQTGTSSSLSELCALDGKTPDRAYPAPNRPHHTCVSIRPAVLRTTNTDTATPPRLILELRTPLDFWTAAGVTEGRADPDVVAEATTDPPLDVKL